MFRPLKIAENRASRPITLEAVLTERGVVGLATTAAMELARAGEGKEE